MGCGGSSFFFVLHQGAQMGDPTAKKKKSLGSISDFSRRLFFPHRPKTVKTVQNNVIFIKYTYSETTKTQLNV